MEKSGNYLDKLNTMVLDILSEIGNIGAGNAATALAKLINQKVDMKVPKVNILEFKEVPEILGGAETEVVGIYFKIEGDLDGSIMFLLDLHSAYSLINLLMPGYNVEEINDFSMSALKEIGNILSGSYIASLSGLTNLNIKISVPSLAVDMAGAILSVPAIFFSEVSDKILIIKNEFLEEADIESINGYFLLVPELDSYDVLLKSLGVSLWVV